MEKTRSGEMVSAQIGKMGVIDNLTSGDFSLVDGQCFNVKNDGTQAVELQVQLATMGNGEFVETKFEVGWNPEIVKPVKQTPISRFNQLWGY